MVLSMGVVLSIGVVLSNDVFAVLLMVNRPFSNFMAHS